MKGTRWWKQICSLLPAIVHYSLTVLTHATSSWIAEETLVIVRILLEETCGVTYIGHWIREGVRITRKASWSSKCWLGRGWVPRGVVCAAPTVLQHGICSALRELWGLKQDCSGWASWTETTWRGNCGKQTSIAGLGVAKCRVEKLFSSVCHRSWSFLLCTSRKVVKSPCEIWGFFF